MSFKPIDAKRDEFRKYLERTGVLEAISKVFIKLIHHTNRPENAIDYVCENLGSTLHKNDQIENLQRDLENSRDEIAQLKQIIENLKCEKIAQQNQINDNHVTSTNQPAAEEYLSEFVENQEVTKETDIKEDSDKTCKTVEPVINAQNDKINSDVTTTIETTSDENTLSAEENNSSTDETVDEKNASNKTTATVPVDAVEQQPINVN